MKTIKTTTKLYRDNRDVSGWHVFHMAADNLDGTYTGYSKASLHFLMMLNLDTHDIVFIGGNVVTFAERGMEV